MHHHVFHKLNLPGHDLGHKAFQMIDGLVSLGQSMFTLCCKVDDFWLQLSITETAKFTLQSAEKSSFENRLNESFDENLHKNGRRCNAMR